MNSRLLCGAMALAVVGCSSSSAPMLPSAAAAHFGRAHRASGSPLLYVSDPVANAVLVYDASGRNQSPIATISQGIDGPAGMAVDASGNLYVANTAGNTIAQYAPNGSAPETTYSRGVLGPVDVAVDGAGTVYVANFYSFAASIVEFSSGSQSPSVTITDPCSCSPVGLALDAKDDLYVAYDDYYSQTLIYEYAAGSSKGTALGYQFGQERYEAPGLVFDSKGNLLIADATLPGVLLFPPGKQSPSKTFGKRGAPRFAQFDSRRKNLFVTDTASGDVEEYAYPSGREIDRIGNGLKSVYGVTLSPRAPL